MHIFSSRKRSKHTATATVHLAILLSTSAEPGTHGFHILCVDFIHAWEISDRWYYVTDHIVNSLISIIVHTMHVYCLYVSSRQAGLFN